MILSVFRSARALAMHKIQNKPVARDLPLPAVLYSGEFIVTPGEAALLLRDAYGLPRPAMPERPRPVRRTTCASCGAAAEPAGQPCSYCGTPSA